MSQLTKVFVRNFHFTLANARGPLKFDGWFPRDHKPGPYPKTDEERRIAAMKYGLRPEDYKPISPSDVMDHSGDYPDLGTITFAHKDPYEAWTDRLNRRNWGEAVPMNSIRYRGDRITFTGLEEEDFKTWNAILMTLRVVLPMILLSYYFTQDDPNILRWKNPAMPKQYPYDFYRAFPFEDPKNYPIVNYTFEPAE
ncbi:NADH dehydrogenase [ubiquinone] 1 beta subcomplex subunit 8 family-containing protein [Strongyloides ratti]|uniref:NADH dehydrogenase [ubiquinone] 1 beta subcomplex subunit 8 family-containing protein n=1 Tax=Strongyloides ratti TaxID=34506 RepID=A0A090L2S7_STRRB|nr:NADH dehydrogenase [ubiquinone] 1 beta subcomplex subunit 8 family-containing protein [Strongyloides ratti]CEF62412.1 NADH dehydrogenase [ubiquinone] 1 beta subcomplex subunit 8 family-containing protein [Strongyloides ratti]